MFLKSRSRGLTQGELAIAKTAFPDLNTDVVRISYGMMGKSAFTPNNTMHFPTSVRGCLDFSTYDGGRFIGWLVHELAHTWQFQHRRNPFWGHIFSSDLFSFGSYLSKEQYHQTLNPAALSTEKQADWHMWRYLCTIQTSGQIRDTVEIDEA